jgi:DMSO/TMAO reductase YedYZ molybdopterin-dependent catalytic subunit
LFFTVKYDNPGLIVRGEEPLNLEMPFETLDGFITPTDSFYVRTHFPIPTINEDDWRLQIGGEVNDPFSIDYDELVRLPSRTLPATLECAGNNRNLLQTKVKGVQWGLGAVGNAEWTGVPLATLLQRAGVNSAGCEVILEGADRGTVDDPKAPRGELKFARSIPMAKALDDVLLAYRMNGADLPPEHGFPVRAIVPGWYAVASIKWLQRVIVTTEPFKGYYQTLDYSFWKRTADDLAVVVPLTALQTKAQIAQPIAGQKIARNEKVRVHGAAWGATQITRVEVSTDGGATWNDAKLLGDGQPGAWRLWDFAWTAPADPGEYRLVARANDPQGHGQPVDRDTDRGTYMISHLLPIKVEVR